MFLPWRLCSGSLWLDHHRIGTGSLWFLVTVLRVLPHGLAVFATCALPQQGAGFPFAEDGEPDDSTAASIITAMHGALETLIQAYKAKSMACMLGLPMRPARYMSHHSLYLPHAAVCTPLDPNSVLLPDMV